MTLSEKPFLRKLHLTILYKLSITLILIYIDPYTKRLSNRSIRFFDNFLLQRESIALYLRIVNAFVESFARSMENQFFSLDRRRKD